MPGSLRTALSTAGAVAWAVVGTLIFGLLAAVVGWFPPRGNAMLWCARTWSRILLLAGRVRVESRFEEPLAAGASYVFLANHQSYFDIPALLVTLPGQVRFAAKRSLFRIPFFGWALHAGGFIPIDRTDRSSAQRSFATAARHLGRGVSVFFFPEGSRTHDGELGPFERGGFLLALKSGLPIVPVGIQGARPIMPRGTLKVRPGKILLRYGSPVDVSAYGVRRRRELTDHVRQRIGKLADSSTSSPNHRP